METVSFEQYPLSRMNSGVLVKKPNLTAAWACVLKESPWFIWRICPHVPIVSGAGARASVCDYSCTLALYRGGL